MVMVPRERASLGRMRENVEEGLVAGEALRRVHGR